MTGGGDAVPGGGGRGLTVSIAFWLLVCNYSPSPREDFIRSLSSWVGFFAKKSQNKIKRIVVKNKWEISLVSFAHFSIIYMMCLESRKMVSFVLFGLEEKRPQDGTPKNGRSRKKDFVLYHHPTNPRFKTYSDGSSKQQFYHPSIHSPTRYFLLG